MLAHGPTGFEGFDLIALALSASPPFLFAAWWLTRRSRARR
jgi:hypothetical protein